MDESRRKFIGQGSLIVSSAALAGKLGLAHAADDNTPPAFKNGPYLLAPKTGSMVIAWESTHPVEAIISYGQNKEQPERTIKVSPKQNSPLFQGAKMNLYHIKLENLSASEKGTKYHYRVELSGGESYSASFTTLGTNPGNVKILTVSDSHLFTTRDKINEDIKAIQPALIIHSGDIVEGTGTQAEQFSFWFKGKEEDFIHFYPVVYSAGNHDAGGDYFNAYVYDIQDEEYGGKVKGNSSFDFAGMHISLMDSNPWGLFQMNSEATGKKATQETLDIIQNSLAWLKSDLESNNAKAATFRVLSMHHPVSDAYTRRYIPPVAEPGGVDVFIGGHWHAYARQVSENPEIGAGTLYFTQQDARIYSDKGNYFVIDVDAEKGLMVIKNFACVSPTEKTKLVNTTVFSKNKQQLSWSDIAITPLSILSNGEVTVAAKVKNDGAGLAAAVFPINDNGQIRHIYKFDNKITVLDPGTSVALTGTLPLAQIGLHTLTLADTSVEVDVAFRPATYAYTRLRTKLGDGPVSNVLDNRLFVKADVKNIGNEAGIALAEFFIDGKLIESKKYRLQAGETKTVEFFHLFEQAGKYEVSIGNAEKETVFIEGAIRGMPIVKDKSGNGNDAYIHGAPRLGKDAEGKTSLILDGKRDYLEIPDTGKYRVKDAMTGMVWAKFPSKGTKKGGVSELLEPFADGKGVVPDRNPLMAKGIGLGWGTPYLFRMVVRETGKVGYGVCFLDDNGEFTWSDSKDAQAGIKKDVWVQYTSAFDCKSGANSWQNGFLSAKIGKPVFDAPLKNWEGEPLKVGHGYMYKLLTKRNRGMYVTLLPAEISQVRFYTSKISEAENTDIRQNPSLPNTSKNALKVWLDFEPGNLVNKGVHTTEWVEVSATSIASLELLYKATFSGKAGITATVQSSNNGKKVLREKKISLRSGEHSLMIKELGKCRYLRIITAFESDLNSTESSVPVLHEYVLNAGVKKRWNTLADWRKGSFIDAAGYQLEDHYRSHAADFADYSGKVSEPETE